MKNPEFAKKAKQIKGRRNLPKFVKQFSKEAERLFRVQEQQRQLNRIAREARAVNLAKAAEGAGPGGVKVYQLLEKIEPYNLKKFSKSVYNAAIQWKSLNDPDVKEIIKILKNYANKHPNKINKPPNAPVREPREMPSSWTARKKEYEQIMRNWMKATYVEASRHP